MPGGYTMLGKDRNISYHGDVIAGAAHIDFDEFEPAGSVTLSGFQSVTMYTSVIGIGSNTDTATISSSAAGVNQVVGDSVGLSWVPLVTSGVGRLKVGTGINDLFPAVAGDQIKFI